MSTLTVELHPGTGQADEQITVHHADGTAQRIDLHDYAAIYRIPGLYEYVVQKRLQCASPRMLATMLANIRIPSSGDVRVVDYGAGIGTVGDELQQLGVTQLIGVDRLPEARDGAFRDRPGMYQDYLLDDGPMFLPRISERIFTGGFNALVCAGAISDTTHVPLRRLTDVWRAFPPNSHFVIDGTTADFGGRNPAKVVEAFGPHTRLLGHGVYIHRLLMDGRPIRSQYVVGWKEATS